MWNQFVEEIQQGNVRSIARSISLVENEVTGYEQLLSSLPDKSIPLIGITGPPGAGKSTLTDALTAQLIQKGKRVAILCVDPSSPFHQGAILGDRIRMSRWYNHPNVYIRSLATRGALGGLHPKIIELTEILKAAPFDYILLETVGVGQSEVEIAGLADVTLVVLVPEAGDEIQTMKSGLMEIADVFVVNKADRPGSDTMIKNLRLMVHEAHQTKPIVATQANQEIGIENLIRSIDQTLLKTNERLLKDRLIIEKIYWIIQQHRMKDIRKEELLQRWKSSPHKNVYRFLQDERLI
ncbi:methylmalonyl Co-A mutase-associated GTPase MeaB [Gynurincola endophyticus]|uniref:methylmalonyl Co-A mutase-associated GTPase MeaB n=1 Tax=Gynurincola endophyticus TaxID=2479004 RepID=UPI000F8D58C5|nr:methylmalonyl Co-A mutase-associated GTPase MeaB [Gynurincola endophyticus]